MSSSNLLAPGTRLGNYELTAFIGEGGMGTVYAAVHLGLGKRVAIKTLRAELVADPDVRARFLREGKAAAAVRHPNVVDVDDVGIQDDVPYLAMELLEGEDLRAFVTRSGRIDVQQTVDIMIPVLLAMSEAHRAGVVHRDLKPDNIFLTRGYGGSLVPKVLDFGISKLREPQSLNLTGNNALLGTPYYMSPEQAGSARDVDARSDLYSIGVILYHCVTGRVPFEGTSLAQVIGQILHAAPQPLRQSMPDVPSGFERIVLQVMAKEPAARFANARDLARVLLPFAGHRSQVTYGAELGLQSQDTLRASEPPSALPTPASVQPTTSTLSPLAHSVTTLRTGTRTGWRLSLLLAAVVLAAIALFWSQAPAQPADSNSALRVIPTPEPAPAAAAAASPVPPATSIVYPVTPLVPPPAALLPDAGAAIGNASHAPRRRPATPEPHAKKPVGQAARTPRPTPSSSPPDVWGDRK